MDFAVCLVFHAGLMSLVDLLCNLRISSAGALPTANLVRITRLGLNTVTELKCRT